MPEERTYPVAPKGLATSFVETEVPLDYASAFRNYFINAAGGAEMRPGMRAFSDTISGTPNLTGLHELVKTDGSTILFTSGSGSLYKYTSGAWSVVKTAIDTTNPLRSVQMDDKLIFWNGVDTDFYTTDGTLFQLMRGRIVTGTETSASSTQFGDGDITNWIVQGDVATNDLVRNVTKNAYAFVTQVTTAAIVHTGISSSAKGLGLVAATAQQTGDIYEIQDLVELNIIPTDLDPDNVGVATGDTSAGGVAVSGVTWTSTEARRGDYLYNVTQGAVAVVSAVGSGFLQHTPITGQTAGDSLIFMKPAMPISDRAHVHYGRLYHIDSRDKTKIRISGADDPLDMSNGATIDSSTFVFGGLQPTGDIAVAMASYQRFFVVAGRKNVFLYTGTDPLTAVSGGTFSPVGLFPQGVAGQDSVVSIGNDVAFLTKDGVQTVSMVGDASTLGRANVSEAIKVTLRDQIAGNPESSIQVIHYPRRSWFLVKIGSVLYTFNYTAFFGEANRRTGDLTATQGSWSIFDGKLARQNFYFIRNNGDMLCCGAGGRVYLFDQGDYTDDGEPYNTEYQSGWLGMIEPRRSVRIKEGVYLKPVIRVGADTTFTIGVEADYNSVVSNETLDVPTSGATSPVGLAIVGTAVVGGTAIFNQKIPLRWRGEAARFRFTTGGGVGPHILSRYTAYWNMQGKR